MIDLYEVALIVAIAFWSGIAGFSLGYVITVLIDRVVK